jgi:putative thioredoxin
MGYDVRDFEAEVIRASHEVPVVVDFWAAWCGPCRILGPVLERLADEAGGRWHLAKVDTEAHPELAAAYGIRGIPDVRLFVDGEPVDGFMGALPESAIRRWLDQALPTPEARASGRELARLEALAHEGRVEEARAGLEALLEAAPGDGEIRYRLARLLVFGDPPRSLELVDRLDPPKGVTPEAVEAIRTLARLVADVEAKGEAGEADDLARAVAFLRDGEVEGALEALITLLRARGPGSDARIQRACVALFHHLGHEHPTTTRFRGEFSRALYV